MLTKQNKGKYFSEEWKKDRWDCIVDSSKFTAEEKTWLMDDSTFTSSGMYQDQKFEIDTTPVDSETTSKPNNYDVRTRPECGDAGYIATKKKEIS